MNNRSKVLVIDDEIKLVKLIQNILTDKYDVITAENGEDGVAIAQSEKPDLILVDQIMPKMDGIATTQFIRNCISTKNTPVIMLTALKETQERTKAFLAGVDDFISKPFHPEELLARISSKLTRFKILNEAIKANEYNYLNLRINLDERTAYISDKAIHLTPLEFELLRCLVANLGRVQSRQQLLAEIWKDAETNERALDAHITSLRKKTKRFAGLIDTVYGRGYIIREK
jgi:two-component system alkaline phosphatase synthesis response regulator PhoP